MNREISDYLRIITQASYNKVEEKLEKYGLVKGQAYLLVLIRDNDGCTQKDLAELLGVRYSSISERLNKLENLGYIERNIDESNSKFKRISTTSAGKVAAIQCRRIQNEFEELMYSGFTKKEIKQLGNYLDRICENVEK